MTHAPTCDLHATSFRQVLSPIPACEAEARRAPSAKVGSMAQASSSTSNVGTIVNIALPLFLLALLIALCVQLLLPFVGLLVWTIILAICFKPLHDRLMNKRGMSSRRAAVV